MPFIPKQTTPRTSPLRPERQNESERSSIELELSPFNNERKQLPIRSTPRKQTSFYASSIPRPSQASPSKRLQSSPSKPAQSSPSKPAQSSPSKPAQSSASRLPRSSPSRPPPSSPSRLPRIRHHSPSLSISAPLQPSQSTSQQENASRSTSRNPPSISRSSSNYRPHTPTSLLAQQFEMKGSYYMYKQEYSEDFADYYNNRWWLQVGQDKYSKHKKSPIIWGNPLKTSTVWALYNEGVEIGTGAPAVVCKVCDSGLVHPSLGGGTTSMTEHLSTGGCKERGRKRGIDDRETQRKLKEKVSSNYYT